MSDPSLQAKVELYEHFFRHPQIDEDRALGPELAGIACRNIRDALRDLKYRVATGDRYDSELKEVVRDFQIKFEHVLKTAKDGCVGPRTRKLLTEVVLTQVGEEFFQRGRLSPQYAVFVSYARKDEGRVLKIVDKIKACGIPVFLDTEAIPAGASWPDVLYLAIRKCQLFLCMLSPQAAESVNVLIEVALACHADRPIVPVLLQAVELPSTLRSLVGYIQRLDLSGKHDAEEGLAEVLQALSLYGLSPPPRP